MAITILEDISKCCGCAACENICPADAIHMHENEDGFLYPFISEDLCVKCRRCVSACPVNNKLCLESNAETYVAVAKNIDLTESSSGGAFPGLAINFLEQGGIVYGCAMEYVDGQITVHHRRVDADNNLSILKGSKYVQSTIGYTYRDVQKDLSENKKVLFSGTPCQVAGLYTFLKKSYSNLYTVDIVCHGVPSLHFFRSYISFLEKKEDIKIAHMAFRDKTEGWKLYGRIDYEDIDGNIIHKYFDAEESSYYQLFLSASVYRESCYQCPYASRHRPADITLADYWCIDLVHPELLLQNGGPIDEKKGVSTLVINNEKGAELLECYGKNISVWDSSYENASRYNKQFVAPSKLPDNRKKVLQLYRKDYRYVNDYHFRKLTLLKTKRKIKKAIRIIVKKTLKKVSIFVFMKKGDK